jgi:PTS system nitrogen regulatory IIA component
VSQVAAIPPIAENGMKESMHRIINHLIQLQDLTVARAQQEATMPGTRLAQLETSIQTLLDELPEETRQLFARAQKKDLLAIIPISRGVCSACGMLLPVSLVHAVRAAEKLHLCPNCARMLYYPEIPLRRESPRKRRGDPPRLGIERFSSQELMIPRLASETREEVIAELCAKMEQEGFVDNASRLAEEALRREAIVSTAVDQGLAFPHVRGVEGGGLTLTLGIKPKGLAFGAPARRLSRIFFFMVIPTAASAFYLKVLSGLTQAFREEEARERLLEADTPEKLWRVLARSTKAALQ